MVKMLWLFSALGQIIKKKKVKNEVIILVKIQALET